VRTTVIPQTSLENVSKEDILVHTNNIEGYWNILKKQIDGIHHSVSPQHLQRYCNESAFRFNFDSRIMTLINIADKLEVDVRDFL
jgi:hypothetical protein